MKKKTYLGMITGLLCGLLSLGLWHSGLLDGLENATWALRVRTLAKPTSETSRIRIVLLDQASLDWGYSEQRWSWPWWREAYGVMVGYFHSGGARAVGLDVLFTEDSIHGVPDDRALADGIAEAGNVVTALYLTRGDSSEAATWPAEVPRPGVAVEGMEAWLTRNRENYVRAGRINLPIPEIARSSRMLAHVVEEPDRDAVIRSAGLFRRFGDVTIPSLGFGLYLAGDPVRTLTISDGTLELGGRRIPIDEKGRVLLNYRGPRGTYETYSARDVLRSAIATSEGQTPAIPAEVFRDTYVLFGFSAPGLLDLRPTPLSPVTPGVEVHATLLDNLLAGDPLADPSPLSYALGLLLFGALVGTIGTSVAGVRPSIGLFLVVLALPVAGGFGFYRAGIWLPVVPAVFTAVGGLFAAFLINYVFEGRQKAFIKSAFQRYLSPAVIQRLLEDPSRLRLGGERRELSIFFSDLQGFSSFSEKMDSAELAALLNAYLTDMTDIILEEGGTLDKYEGDAIIAFWNAPIEQADHAERCCRTALRCQRRLDEKRADFRARAGVELRARIGIHTGDAHVGNMGSSQRFDYTVLGDAANLASRLEGANKIFGTYLMISDTTWSRLGDYPGRELGSIRVVGRETPVRVHELSGLPGESSPESVENFETGRRAFEEGRLEDAKTAFQRCGQDPPARAYMKRIDRLMENANGQDYERVWNLTEK